ncbi:MAG: hypothetical protein CFE23_02470 [Flavobacterium sp. BFFFF1]|uniref:hypothetical protein n=2 Tax=unclassified Flavobacterium TaxID=196869 RepID=UPI000BCEEE6F|nr:hypothetical protein [Flavobacterium sp.]OYU81768.1 MAG: hypothetical protein CFE23_02470 [Flavobacterium sp. BFFFF1]
MGTIKNTLAGLAGAVALNVLHESLKHLHNTPRIDLLGEEALQEGLEQMGIDKIKDKDTLYGATLGGDILSNAAYYSLIGAGQPEHYWARAITLGVVAGVGAVVLPEKMGLHDQPVARNNTVKALTVGYYVVGALVTAAVLSAGRDKPSEKIDRLVRRYGLE